MNKIIKILTVGIVELTLLIVFTNNIEAATTCFTDNFNDGNADGWEETPLSFCGDSSWSVNNIGQYGIAINSIVGCKTQSILKSVSIPENSDYIFEFDMTFSQNQNMDRNFYIKYRKEGEWYGFHIVNYMIDLEKIYWGQIFDDPFQPITYPFQANQTYHFNVSVMNDVIVLMITNSLNETFTHTYFDNAPILPNQYVGLRASTGSITSSEVWFDNVNLTIIQNDEKQLFNLPISYPYRDSPNEAQFSNAFWSKMTAAFDHNKQGNKFVPFTTDPYNKRDCPKGTLGITCYDAHNGTDYAPHIKGSKDDVFPVADGKIIYASPVEKDRCIPDKSGYGCVVIIYHPDHNLYSLYAHLSKIVKNIGSEVEFSDKIAEMGNTGCGPKCGVHLHLGVMKDKTSVSSKQSMTTEAWEDLLKQVEPLSEIDTENPPKHWCNYKAINGNILSFQDPSGWSANTQNDPWSLPIDQGSCDTDSPYLWMHEVGTSNSNLLLQEFWYKNGLL